MRCPALARPVFTDALRVHNLCTYDHAAFGLYTTAAYSLTGGNILQWYRSSSLPARITRRSSRALLPNQPACWCCRTAHRPARPTSICIRTGPSWVCGFHHSSRSPAGPPGGRGPGDAAQPRHLRDSGFHIAELLAIGGGAGPRPDATQGRRARPPYYYVERSRGGLPGRGHAGLRRRNWA